MVKFRPKLRKIAPMMAKDCRIYPRERFRTIFSSPRTILGTKRGPKRDPKGARKSAKTCPKGDRKPNFFWKRFRRCFPRLLGSKTEVKSPKICPKGGPKTKTVIFRKSCSRVHGSTIFEVRTPWKLSRNLRETVSERRREPERVSGAIFIDFGAVSDLKTEPKLSKNGAENEAKKQNDKKGAPRSNFVNSGDCREKSAARWRLAGSLVKLHFPQKVL